MLYSSNYGMTNFHAVRRLSGCCLCVWCIRCRCWIISCSWCRHSSCRHRWRLWIMWVIVSDTTRGWTWTLHSWSAVDVLGRKFIVEYNRVVGTTVVFRNLSDGFICLIVWFVWLCLCWRQQRQCKGGWYLMLVGMISCVLWSIVACRCCSQYIMRAEVDGSSWWIDKFDESMFVR